ncbi:MAG TPA: hypothetical protein PK347_10385 [Burkholderiaceae bacterium]|nr:hypothetical protein [Burkholderiaceae bacterium]
MTVPWGVKTRHSALERICCFLEYSPIFAVSFGKNQQKIFLLIQINFNGLLADAKMAKEN